MAGWLAGKEGHGKGRSGRRVGRRVGEGAGVWESGGVGEWSKGGSERGRVHWIGAGVLIS